MRLDLGRCVDELVSVHVSFEICVPLYLPVLSGPRATHF